jgi:phosphatidylserine decarboxylase
MSQFSWAEPPRQTGFPVAKAGYPFIAAVAFATAVLALLGLATLSVLGLAATFFICWFFRDPDRPIPQEAQAFVSPADGKVIAVRPTETSAFVEGRCLQISIFMNVFNVHVNRVPYGGVIKKIAYKPGEFWPANQEKALQNNEQNALWLETENGASICFVQIAGLVARRIICQVQEGDQMVRGQRFGLICFGSRVDLYLPADAVPNVSVGQKVSAGTSILGYLK